MSARAALCLATLAALGAALPAALGASAVFPVWLALSGSVALVLGPLAVGAVRAPPLAFPLQALLLGLGFTALPLARVAATLKNVTHHRPLGAVTFAFVALALALGAIAVAARLFDRARDRRARWLLIALAAAGPLALMVRLARASDARHGLFDGGLAFGVLALVLLAPWPPRWLGLAAKLGFPLWLFVVALGIAVGCGAARSAAVAASPALFAPLAWLCD